MISDLDEINYLGNVHNAVYFAVKVLTTQKRYFLFYLSWTLSVFLDLTFDSSRKMDN